MRRRAVAVSDPGTPDLAGAAAARRSQDSAARGAPESSSAGLSACRLRSSIC